MGTVADKLLYLQETKDAVKTAIENKGVAVPENTTFREYATLIGDIDNTVELEQMTVTPTGQEITITPHEGYDGISQIVVEGDMELVPENIVTGHSIYGVAGSHTDPIVDPGGGSGEGSGGGTPAEPLLQSKTVTPTGQDISVTPDEGYDGLDEVTVEGDYNLTPENIASGVTIYGVAGTLLVGAASSVPSNYESYVTAAEGIYGGAYENKMILENDEYISIGFMMDDFTVTAYNSGTGEFSASGWYRCSYNKSTRTWTQADYTFDASTGDNFIRNVRYASCYIYYGETIIWPLQNGAGGGSGSGSGTQLNPEDIKAGVTVNGVTGTYTGGFIWKVYDTVISFDDILLLTYTVQTLTPTT